MSEYQSLAHRYREIAVKTANPLQLVVMLYDAAICSIQEAQEHMRAKNIGARARAINKCNSIISELQSCLDMKNGGEIADSLDRLYDYMRRRIFVANLEQNPEPLNEIECLLDSLRSAWKELIQKNQAVVAPHPPAEQLIGGPAPFAAQHSSFNVSI